jgi:hypothetical protein
MTKVNTTKMTSARPFAADGTAPPADVLLTWAEVQALGLTEAPTDIGSSDWQVHLAAKKESQR